MGTLSNLFGRGKRKQEDPSDFLLEDLHIGWKMPAYWKMQRQDYTVPGKKGGRVALLYPTGLERSVRVSILQEKTDMSIQNYARAAIADIQTQELYAGAKIGDINTIKRGQIDWAEFVASLRDGTLVHFHFAKSCDNSICFGIVYTIKLGVFDKYQGDVSCILETFHFLPQASLPIQNPPKKDASFYLWLKNPQDAMNRELIAMMCVQNGFLDQWPKWTAEKAYMGNYKIVTDHKLIRERGQGCVVVFNPD